MKNAFNITTMPISKFLITLFITLLVNSSSFSQVLYSSTASASRFNPGLGSLGTPVIAFDDVHFPAAAENNKDSVSITKINVGIRRMPNAPATNVNIYYTTMQEGSLQKHLPVFLGKVSLPVNGGSFLTSIISLGDSVTALFKIKPEASVGSDQQQTLMIGASFDNPSSANGIILTKTPGNNTNSIWIDNSDNNNSMYATSFNGQLPATYYLEVFGNKVSPDAGALKNLNADVAVHRINVSNF